MFSIEDSGCSNIMIRDTFGENDTFASLSGGHFDSSTPTTGRSVSYFELRSPYAIDSSCFSDTSLERMRCLSQSISDLKTLREKQLERRHEMKDLMHDDFLHEHARKLKAARSRIKELEAKYRTSKHASWARDKSSDKHGHKQIATRKMRQGMQENDETDTSKADKGCSSDGHMLPSKISNVIEKEDKTALDIPGAELAPRPRPVSWAHADDPSCSSDSKFMRPRGLSWQNLEKYHEKDFNRNSCFHGDQGKRMTSELIDLPAGPHATQSTHEESHVTNFKRNKKWHSVPSLSENCQELLENRKLMYGEAIPMETDERKHHKKFSRKSGLYIVNEIRGKNEHPSSMKRKFREKLFPRKGEATKTLEKHVGSPKEGVSLGKVVGWHPVEESAYIVELNRAANASFGFHIQTGYRQHRNGIFVSKIDVKNSEKFLRGLLHEGDEILQVNATKVQHESLAFVKKLIKSTDKLQLSILPYSSRTKKKRSPLYYTPWSTK